MATTDQTTTGCGRDPDTWGRTDRSSGGPHQLSRITFSPKPTPADRTLAPTIEYAETVSTKQGPCHSVEQDG